MKNIVFKLVVPLLGIIAMLAFVTWVSPIKQQNASGCTSANGNNWCAGNQHYTMDNGGIIVYIDPVANTCSSNITSFASSMNVHAGGTNPGAYTIHWGWVSNFCTSGSGPCEGGANDSIAQSSGNLSGNSSVTASAASSDKGSFANVACGKFQNDFGFYVTRNSDGHNVGGVSLGTSLNSTNNNATWCSTGRDCQVPTNTPVPPTATPTLPVATATPTIPVATATPSNTNNCGNNNQSGNNDNNNCNNNNNNNNNQQQQQQTQNNNQSVNITLGNGQQQQQQQVLGMTTLPKTGAEGDILFGLLALIPVGWKLRKLV